MLEVVEETESMGKMVPNKPYFLRYFLPQSIDLFLLHTSYAVAAFLLYRPVLHRRSRQPATGYGISATSDRLRDPATSDFDFFSLSQLRFHSDLACSTAPASDFTSNLLSYLRFHFEHSSLQTLKNKQSSSCRLQTFGPPLLLQRFADVVRRLQMFWFRKNKQHLRRVEWMVFFN
ncbi:hypothetical protein LXL04_025427 [Taraxacum kok-saghyz]